MRRYSLKVSSEPVSISKEFHVDQNWALDYDNGISTLALFVEENKDDKKGSLSDHRIEKHEQRWLELYQSHPIHAPVLQISDTFLPSVDLGEIQSLARKWVE